MRPDRLFFRMVKQFEKAPLRVYEPDPTKAVLVGSRLPTGGHSPVLDLDFEAALVPSTTPGHYHLYLDGLVLDDDTYAGLLEDLALAGVIQEGFANQYERHGQTFLRPPGVMKDPDDGLDSDSGTPGDQ